MSERIEGREQPWYEPDWRRSPQNWLPPPIQRPSDQWLAAHKDILYDRTENWQKSNMLLRLGTIAVNYDLKDRPADCSKFVTFGVKVAFKSPTGEMQTWRDLPFAQPDFSPYVKDIVEQISSCLSVTFATKSELSALREDVTEAVDAVALSAGTALISSYLAREAAGEAAAEAAAAKNLALSAAYDAGLAILCASSAFTEAAEAKADAASAAEDASRAEISSAYAVSAAVSAFAKAAEVNGIALSALSAAQSADYVAGMALFEAMEAERHAYRHDKDIRFLSATADWLSVMPVDSDRFTQGVSAVHLDCGTAMWPLQ